MTERLRVATCGGWPCIVPDPSGATTKVALPNGVNLQFDPLRECVVRWQPQGLPLQMVSTP